MSALTAYGTFAVAFMFATYWLEARHRLFVAAFALGCAMSSLYGLLAGTYPFFVVEGLWSMVALRRFQLRNQREQKAVTG